MGAVQGLPVKILPKTLTDMNTYISRLASHVNRTDNNKIGPKNHKNEVENVKN